MPGHTNLSHILFSLILLACLCACVPDPYSDVTTDISVTFNAESFSPKRWKVPSNQEITLEMTNNSPEVRDWLFISKPVQLPLSVSDYEFIYFEAHIEPGQSKVVKFTAPPAPGEYDILCDRDANEETKLIGKIIVYDSTYLEQIKK